MENAKSPVRLLPGKLKEGKSGQLTVLIEQVREKMNSNEDTQHYTPEELGLSEIWKEFLTLEKVNRDDKYLDLGGNSVALYLIVERIKEKYGFDIDPQIFFHPENSRLSDIASEIKKQTTALA